MASPSRQKLADRVQKLARLAYPTSRTSNHERAAAALEIARLLIDHDLDVVPRRRAAPVGAWKASTAARRSQCSCGESIEIGEKIWMKIDGFRCEYRHQACR